MNILLLILTFLLTPALIIGLLTFIEERTKKRIRLTLEKLLNRLVKKNKLMLEDIEFFGRKAIGLDKKIRNWYSLTTVTMLLMSSALIWTISSFAG